MAKAKLQNRIKSLPLWQGDIKIAPLGGGITNINFTVNDAHRKYVVRVGQDIPQHHVMRFNELAASRAAHTAGLSPAVVYAEPGIMVLDFIDGETLTDHAIRTPQMLQRIIPLVKACHNNVDAYLRGPQLIFWVFHVLRDYAAQLACLNSPNATLAGELQKIGDRLEKDAGPFDMVFSHNDLLAGNFLDTGDRLWLIDWDYGGFNSPLFDLGGLASNNGLDQTQEFHLLESYFETALTDDLWRRYSAMKCASLLRETMWSMVSEHISEIDFDYAAYTAENLERFRASYDLYSQS
jgi:thiamine kinase-like enzyme